MNQDITPNNPVLGVNRAFDILELILQENQLSLGEIANKTGVAKSTAHRYLKTLESRGYLIYENNEYKISHRFTIFTHHIRTRNSYYPLIQEKISDVAEKTGELVQFGIEEYGSIIYIFSSRGSQGIQINAEVGKPDPLHSTACGKAIMSTWSTEEIDTYIKINGLQQITSQTITDSETLHQNLQQTNERGYSINNQENIEQLKAIGVPVRDSNNQCIGAISVAGPTRRMNQTRFENELIDFLLGISNELELNFRFKTN